MKYFVLLAGYGEMTPWEKMTEAEQQKVFEASSEVPPESVPSVLVDALAGESGEGSGMGVGLPLLLGAIALGGAVASLVRRQPR